MIGRNYIPILVDLKQFPALVIGAGNVGRRKIKNLLDFNGNITVIAEEVHQDVREWEENGRIKVEKRAYRKGDVKDFGIVFAATDNTTLDELIKQDCDEHGILLNVADIPPLCNFFMPSTVKRGPLTVSVGSQGRAPFMVAYMRRFLENTISNTMEHVAELAGSFRDKMIETRIYYDNPARKRLINNFLDKNWEEIIDRSSFDEALKMALDMIEHELEKKADNE